MALKEDVCTLNCTILIGPGTLKRLIALGGRGVGGATATAVATTVVVVAVILLLAGLLRLLMLRALLVLLLSWWVFLPTGRGRGQHMLLRGIEGGGGGCSG
jgi:hypothetical protein